MIARSLTVVGAAAVVGALLAFAMPMRLYFVDRAGVPIPCGTGFGPRYDVARQQDQLNLAEYDSGGTMFVVSNYAEQCEALVTDRRAIAAPVVAAGVGTVLTAFVIRRRRETAAMHRMSPAAQGSFRAFG
jgi:hypothetical protein